MLVMVQVHMEIAKRLLTRTARLRYGLEMAGVDPCRRLFYATTDDLDNLDEDKVSGYQVLYIILQTIVPSIGATVIQAMLEAPRIVA